jgi:hypothetical protein
MAGSPAPGCQHRDTSPSSRSSSTSDRFPRPPALDRPAGSTARRGPPAAYVGDAPRTGVPHARRASAEYGFTGRGVVLAWAAPGPPDQLRPRSRSLDPTPPVERQVRPLRRLVLLRGWNSTQGPDRHHDSDPSRNDSREFLRVSLAIPGRLSGIVRGERSFVGAISVAGIRRKSQAYPVCRSPTIGLLGCVRSSSRPTSISALSAPLVARRAT